MRFNFFNNNTKKIKVGLALGGGATRGFAHMGVIKAFEEYGIEFDFIAGTSAGSIVGAMYAKGMKSDEMIYHAKQLNEKEIRTSKIPFMPSKLDSLEAVLTKVLGDIEFKDLKYPFCAVATDVRTGNEIHITKGKLARSITASCAVPAVFSPVEIGEYLLFDGGLTNNIPSSVPKLFGCDVVVSVDVNSTRGQGTKSTKYFDLMVACTGIMMKGNSVRGYSYADVMVQPDLKRFSSTKMAGLDEMVEEGYKATVFKINEIKALFGNKNSRKKVFFEADTVNRKNRMLI